MFKLKQAEKLATQKGVQHALNYALSEVQKAPTDYKAHAFIANVAMDNNQLPIAEKHINAALKSGQSQPEVQSVLAKALIMTSRFDQAMPLLQHIPKTHRVPHDDYHLGLCLSAVGETEAALEAFRAAYKRAPQNAQFAFNLALRLHDENRAPSDHALALKILNKLRQQPPKEPEITRRVLALYARALYNTRHYADCLAFVEAHQDAAPDLEQRLLMLDTVYYSALSLGDLAKAEAVALEMKTHARSIPLNVHLGKTLLHAGHYDVGWAHFNHRLVSDEFTKAELKPLNRYPQWAGHPAEGHNIVVVSDQGLGDQVLLLSTVEDLRQQSRANIQVCLDSRLIDLASSSYPKITFHPQDQFDTLAAQAHAVQGLSNLATFFRPSEQAIKSHQTQLTPSAGHRAEAKAYIGERTKKRIGLSWWSMFTAHAQDRSPPEGFFLKLIEAHPEIEWVNIQYKSPTPEQSKVVSALDIPALPPAFDPMGDQAAFSALLLELDGVLTIANTTAHVAGALGVNTAVLSNLVPRFYLGGHGEAIPFYESLTVIRQKASQSNDLNGWIKAYDSVEDWLSLR